MSGRESRFTFVSTCMADHRGVFTGPFARVRNRLWWRRHDHCIPMDGVCDALYYALKTCRPWIGDFAQGDEALALYEEARK